MDLRLGQGDGDAEHPAALVRADADRRANGGVADDPAVAHLLVARIEDHIPDLAEGPVAPGFQLVIQKLRRAADLRGGQALDADSRITASTSRVDTPLMYISATASITARTDRRPRSSDWG